LLAKIHGISLAAFVYYVVASLFLGAFVGVIVFTLIGDLWGRRTALLFNLALMSAAYLAIPFAPSPEVLGLLRFVAGLGVGPEALTALDIMVSDLPSQDQREGSRHRLHDQLDRASGVGPAGLFVDTQTDLGSTGGSGCS